MELSTILSILRAHGAAAAGAVHRATLLPYMNAARQDELEARIPNWNSVICTAYPYYINAPRPAHAISRYAWGGDYHAVLKSRMSAAAEHLRENGFRAEIFADASPLPEREAAVLAGIGVLGENGLVVVPEYGSYVFLGEIVTDFPIENFKMPQISRCSGCRACVRACPTGALSADGYDLTRCLSHISQKRGALTDAEAALLRENDCLWGCDRCACVCLTRETELPEFREDLIQTLTADELSGMSEREFRRKYADRAFSWRGKKVIERNLHIIIEGEKHE